MRTHDKDAEFEAYMAARQPSLLRTAYLLSGDRHTAEDLVQTALAKAPAEGPRLLVGDSVWDVKAAGAAGVPTLAVLTGGFAAAELSEAGAAGVAESIAELREDRGRLLAVAR